MKPYRKTDDYTLYLGDAWEVLDSLADNSIDAVVTDPPYEISFMNKGWDNTGVAFDRKTWEKVLRVLKPGGHILAFNHSRTFHRMAVAIEDAGFEIRDTIMWLYGSGFPKSHDISKAIDRQAGAERKVVGERVRPDGTTRPNAHNWSQEGMNEGWQRPWRDNPEVAMLNHQITAPVTEEAKQWEGWGTALKPAYEPILLARKPIPTTVADNVLTHGVGGLNIDECRVGTEEKLNGGGTIDKSNYRTVTLPSQPIRDRLGSEIGGRFPANIIHDGSEEVVDGFPETTSSRSGDRGARPLSPAVVGDRNYIEKSDEPRGHDDDGGSASRFFYTAKASKKDRDEGLRGFEKQAAGGMSGRQDGSMGSITYSRNIHPTVKPTDLMQYLIRLIAPNGATVLDIFMGSGSTGKAAMIENVERDANYHFIGIDRSEEYMPIAEARIEFGRNYATEKPKADGIVHQDQIDLFNWQE